MPVSVLRRGPSLSWEPNSDLGSLAYGGCHRFLSSDGSVDVVLSQAVDHDVTARIVLETADPRVSSSVRWGTRADVGFPATVTVPAGSTRATVPLSVNLPARYREARTVRLRLVDVRGAIKRDPAYCYVTVHQGQEPGESYWPTVQLYGSGGTTGASGTRAFEVGLFHNGEAVLADRDTVVPIALSAGLSGPGSVTVPQGAHSAQFVVTGGGSPGSETVTVGAGGFVARRNVLPSTGLEGPDPGSTKVAAETGDHPDLQPSTFPGQRAPGCDNTGTHVGTSLLWTTSAVDAPAVPLAGAKATHWRTHPDAGTMGCLLFSFDLKQMGDVFDILDYVKPQAGRWAVLSCLFKHDATAGTASDSFALTILDRTEQNLSGTGSATHSVWFEWGSPDPAANAPTVGGTTGLDVLLDNFGVVLGDPLNADGWWRVYVAWKCPEGLDSAGNPYTTHQLQLSISPSTDKYAQTQVDEPGCLMWGQQFEWMDDWDGPTGYQHVPSGTYEQPYLHLGTDQVGVTLE